MHIVLTLFQNAIMNTYRLWPNGEVPYVISSKFSSHERSIINLAVAEMARVSCVRWRPRSNDKDYVHILKDYGCYSRVGKTGGAQVLSLGEHRHVQYKSPYVYLFLGQNLAK